MFAHRFRIIVTLALFRSFGEVASHQCGRESSIYSMMLNGHIFKHVRTSTPLECLQACYNDVRCQSINYVISQGICELNDRTREARPEDFVPNSDRYYFRKDKKRGKI